MSCCVANAGRAFGVFVDSFGIISGFFGKAAFGVFVDSFGTVSGFLVKQHLV
jgi:hypothetical protein